MDCNKHVLNAVCSSGERVVGGTARSTTTFGRRSCERLAHTLSKLSHGLLPLAQQGPRW